MVNDASIARTAELVDYLRALPEPMQARGDGHSSLRATSLVVGTRCAMMGGESDAVGLASTTTQW